MNNNAQKTLGILVGISLLAWGISVAGQKAQTRQVASVTAPDPAMRNKVLRYVRERFGIPEAVKLTLGPFHSSLNPEYYETSITIEDGQKSQTQNISVSKNGQLLAMNAFVPLGSDFKHDIEQYVRQTYKLPPTMQLTIGPFRKADVANFQEATVTATNAGRSSFQEAFVTKDNRFLVFGSVFTLVSNLRAEVLKTIGTKDQPGVGLPNAKVTVVEYADLECPQCARMHEFLEHDVIPKYGDKVRIIFKEFPLVQVHDWAMTAAIASECAYEINPSAFLAYRSLVFRHQSGINATNAREMLIEYGAEEGIDRLELGACIDSKRTLPRVEAALKEGKAVNVGSTPTSFVNGKMVVGTPPPETFYALLDEAIRAGK